MALRICDLKTSPSKENPNKEELILLLAKELELAPQDIKNVTIRKKSLDARKKSNIHYLWQLDFSVPDEKLLLDKFPGRLRHVEPKKVTEKFEHFKLEKKEELRHPPIIVGTGPAGIFAAYILAKEGVPSILIERGEPVEERLRTVNRLRRNGEFNAESHFCYGEGGAGTFSDGKLTCGRNHPMIESIFHTFVKFGAPSDILYQAHPHIGTDYLMKFALNMRTWLKEQGCEFMFSTRFENFEQNGTRSRYKVHLSGEQTLETDHLILAIGHSARETYELLLERQVAMAQKPFAMGFRVEHPQEVIDEIQYGSCQRLPPAEYKLAAKSQSRGIWTFCMCPGGHLLPTSAEEGHLAINGMSYHARNSGFANAALVVNILRSDYDRGHVLDGMKYQRKVERDSFLAGGGKYFTPAQRLEDFLAGRDSKGTLQSTYKPGVSNARLDQILPEALVTSLQSAISDYNQKMRGFVSKEAIVAGVESKTSAPVTILRDESLQSVSHPGIYPTGEGAGFAGGIVSAALDGVRVAQALLNFGV